MVLLCLAMDTGVPFWAVPFTLKCLWVVILKNLWYYGLLTRPIKGSLGVPPFRKTPCDHKVARHPHHLRRWVQFSVRAGYTTCVTLYPSQPLPPLASPWALEGCTVTMC